MSNILNDIACILEIQELDVQMIRLMLLKKKRKEEMDHLALIGGRLQKDIEAKKNELMTQKSEVRLCEADIESANEKLKMLETQQDQVKKIEEFNALAQEISQIEREKTSLTQRLNEKSEQLHTFEEELTSLEEAFHASCESADKLKNEFGETVRQINREGSQLKEQRDAKAQQVNPQILKTYQRLLDHKQSRVVVPIEERSCTGCFMMVTAQHENAVRRGNRLVFCEHCSRIHYWPQQLTGPKDEKPKRRRRSTKQT